MLFPVVFPGWLNWCEAHEMSVLLLWWLNLETCCRCNICVLEAKMLQTSFKNIFLHHGHKTCIRNNTSCVAKLGNINFVSIALFSATMFPSLARPLNSVINLIKLLSNQPTKASLECPQKPRPHPPPAQRYHSTTLLT